MPIVLEGLGQGPFISMLELWVRLSIFAVASGLLLAWLMAAEPLLYARGNGGVVVSVAGTLVLVGCMAASVFILPRYW